MKIGIGNNIFSSTKGVANIGTSYDPATTLEIEILTEQGDTLQTEQDDYLITENS